MFFFCTRVVHFDNGKEVHWNAIKFFGVNSPYVVVKMQHSCARYWKSSAKQWSKIFSERQIKQKAYFFCVLKNTKYKTGLEAHFLNVTFFLISEVVKYVLARLQLNKGI